MKYKKEKFKYLGKQNNLSSHPDNSVLDKHPNPHLNTKYCIRFTCPEFTSICPVTSQPDFAKCSQTFSCRPQFQTDPEAGSGGSLGGSLHAAHGKYY